MSKLKSFLIQSKRVWHVLRKPGKDEVLMISKVSGIGVLVIGAVGFLIAILMGFFG